MADVRLRKLLDRIYERGGRRPPPEPGPEATWQPSGTPEAQQDPLAWFPHEVLRPPQRRFLMTARRAFAEGKTLVAHLPTGVGKTSIALAATLSAPLSHVFYVTNRQTQHDVVIKELRALAESKGRHVGYVDLIGKQQMCVNEDVTHEYRRGRPVPVDYSTFVDRCAGAIEAKACRWYRATVADDRMPAPRPALEMVDFGRAHGRCPYYLAAKRMPASRLVIGDYNMALADQRDVHLDRMGASWADCGIVVDEAHNLPDRVRDLYTRRISAWTVDSAARLVQGPDPESARFLRAVGKRFAAAVERLGEGDYAERAVAADELVPAMPQEERGARMAALRRVAQAVKAQKGGSDLPWRIVRFLDQWLDALPQVRLARREGAEPFLQLRLIDPSAVIRPILTRARWAILMSGTLHPTDAFAETVGLGPEEVVTMTAESPFPRENRVVAFDGTLSTRMSRRTDDQFARYAERIVATLGPGNAAVFAPSYAVLGRIARALRTDRPVLQEAPGMTKEERDAILGRLRATRSTGSVLLAVFGGGFGEGVDFPEGLLPQIYLAGVPFGRWDLETQLTVAHYEKTHGAARGRDLAYNIPAVTRAVQAAGRGIRGPEDRCTIHFLDERYQDRRLRALLPPEYARS